LLYVGLGGTNKAAPADSTSTAKGKIPSAAKLAENGGALALPESVRGSVLDWHSGAGGRDLAAVSYMLGHALQGAAFRQYSQMKYACIQLASRVATAEAGPQIPDTAMQKLYARALTELAKGVVDCRAAISVKANGGSAGAYVDTTRLHLSSSELSMGATDIFRSTAEIEIISRQSH